MVGSVVGPSGRQAADANCTVKVPATSFPKDKIKVLLLENINQTAIDIFKADGFQLVSISAATMFALSCQVPLEWVLAGVTQLTMKGQTTFPWLRRAECVSCMLHGTGLQTCLWIRERATLFNLTPCNFLTPQCTCRNRADR